MKETFGQRFARLRKSFCFKQEDIAEKFNISAQAVSKWENDLSAPDISILPMIADLFNISLDELLGREVETAKFVPQAERKDINTMLLKINVLSSDGDKVKVNIPIALIKVCLESGMDLPQINGKNTLSSIDFNQVFMLIESGVVGELISIESGDGDIVTILVE